MNFIIFLISLLVFSDSVLSSDLFTNIKAFHCPDPAKNSSQIYFNASLPFEVFTPSRFTWCQKTWCYKGGYESSGQIFQTPYVQSLSGFKADIVWNFKEASYTNVSRSREWTIFYNENDCYDGGVEFGVLYWHFHKKFRFYTSIDSNLKTQQWVDKEINFKPIEGANYINVSLIAVNKSFELTFTYSVDERQTFKTLNYKFPFEKWMQEFRYGKGRLTGKINLKAESDSRDSVKFNSVEYFVDRNFFPN